MLFTVAIVAIVALAIMAGLMVGIELRQATRERRGAMRAAADMMETTRRELLQFLEWRSETVLIDDRGTPGNTSDDVTGTAYLEFYDLDGNEIGTTDNPIIPPTTDEDAVLALPTIRVVVTVRWNPAGILGPDERQVDLSSLRAP